MSGHEMFIKIANKVINAFVVIALLIAGTFSAYALWDNEQVYAAAEDVMADMLNLKPTLLDLGAGFEDLLAVNEDVRAWVTLDGTGIDHPVLQGEDNLAYINTDVYGNFALAGSVFLDSRNDSTFADSVSLLYGHNMTGGRMLADLTLYKEEGFLPSHTTGTLMTPDQAYDLEVFACLITPASEDKVFEPTSWDEENIAELYEFVESEAIALDAEAMARAQEEGCRILALSTCSYEFTDARTVVFAAMRAV